MNIKVDFHLHSKYSGATSKKMEIPVISREAKLKGLDVVGMSDAFHPAWVTHLQKTLTPVDDGTWEMGGVRFIITVEVEDRRKVHHLILLPSFAQAAELYEEFKKYSENIDTDGRCHLDLEGNEIVERVKDVDGIVGPAHAFTPWTALYGEYDSVKECYGEYVDRIDFLELGLSADTALADHISELKNLTFMSNSDAHSPWPHRLGREFNVLDVKEKTYAEIKKAIGRKNGRKFATNVGLEPRLGKYHKTACIACYTVYSMEEAVTRNWRCSCGGRIKKGVHDRIMELKDQKSTSPPHRPPYIHIAPLAEIIALKRGCKVFTKKNIAVYEKFLQQFDNEIEVLINAPYEELEEIDRAIAELIVQYREGKMTITPGGGGRYGKLHITAEGLDGWITGPLKQS
jgi:uncharacterized protein (TIGR00375 family)